MERPTHVRNNSVANKPNKPMYIGDDANGNAEDGGGGGGSGYATNTSRRQWRSYLVSNGTRDSTCRQVMMFGFAMVVLAGVFVGLSLFFVREQYDSTHVVVGPRGPMGQCNISHANQTFLIAGNTIIGSNLTVKDTLFVGNTFSAYENASCFVLNSSKPLCMTSCLKTNCISSTTNNGNIVFNDPIIATEGGVFGGDLEIADTLEIGGASFHWNGTALIFTGPSNLGGFLELPLVIGTAGTIDQSGQCILVDATQCIVFDGPVTFSDTIQGPVSISGGALTVDPALYVHSASSGLQWTGTALELFSSASNVQVTSSGAISLIAPTTNVVGDMTLSGTVTNLLKVSQNGLQTTCSPGPQTGSLKFSSDCSCLSLVSTSGICLNATGPQGVKVNGNGGFTLNGPNMNLNFAGGSSIGTSVNVQGAVTTTGNVNVGGDLSVTGNISYTNLYVTGSSYFGGPIYAASTTNQFTGINASVVVSNVSASYSLATFYGQGILVPPGSKLQVGANISISSTAAQVKCTVPIFIPNTLTTPNSSPCVLECTDMQRCSPTMANLTVNGNLAVGTDYTTTTMGNVTFGIMTSKPMGKFTVNALDVRVESSSSVKVSADVDITGNILQNGVTHPCCGGGTPPVAQENYLILELNTNTAALTNTEVDKIPFDFIRNPTSAIASAFNIVTYTFTAPSSGMYAITIYLAMDPGQYGQGTFRGLTIRRSFSLPTFPVSPIRICTHPTDEYSPVPTFFQVTCTYVGYFATGNTFYVTANFDFPAILTLIGASAPSVSPPTTRMEIYKMP